MDGKIGKTDGLESKKKINDGIGIGWEGMAGKAKQELT